MFVRDIPYVYDVHIKPICGIEKNQRFRNKCTYLGRRAQPK